jgi:hypothetical protein
MVAAQIGITARGKEHQKTDLAQEFPLVLGMNFLSDLKDGSPD